MSEHSERETAEESDNVDHAENKMRIDASFQSGESNTRSRARPKRSKSVDATSNLRRQSISINKRTFKAENGWTPEVEVNCHRIAQECAIFKWLHNKNAAILSGKNDRVTLTVALVSAFASATGLTGFITQTYDNQIDEETGQLRLPWLTPTVTILMFILSLAVTIISIIQKTYGFPEKIEMHKSSERSYSWLFFNIQSELQKPIKLRQHGSNYFGWITHEVGGISNSKDIDDDAIKGYYAAFNDNAIPGLDTIDQIELNEDIHSGSGDKSPKDALPFAGSGDEKSRELDLEKGIVRRNAINLNASVRGISEGTDRSVSKKVSHVNPTDIKNFRAFRDANLMSIATKKEKGNGDMMAYELRRLHETQDI